MPRNLIIPAAVALLPEVRLMLGTITAPKPSRHHHQCCGHYRRPRLSSLSCRRGRPLSLNLGNSRRLLLAILSSVALAAGHSAPAIAGIRVWWSRPETDLQLFSDARAAGKVTADYAART